MIPRFIKSRRLLPVIVFAVAVELSLPLWAARAFKITHDFSVAAVPLAVPAQFLVVTVLLYTTTSNFAQLERLAARRMRAHQLCLWAVTAVPVLAATTGACLVIGNSGNIGTYAPIKALLGMWGIGLLATTLIDRRIAGVVPVIAVMLPLVLSPTAVPAAAVWGFVIAPDGSVLSWVSSCTLLLLGVSAHLVWSQRQPR